jgi:hypothetical protein
MKLRKTGPNLLEQRETPVIDTSPTQTNAAYRPSLSRIRMVLIVYGVTVDIE